MHWKFLIDGQLTDNIEIIKEKDNCVGGKQICIIKYNVEGEKYYIKNVKYSKKLNTTLVLYRKTNPKKAIIFSFRQMYFNVLFSISIIVFVLWNAFFFAFRKKELFPGASRFFNISKTE